ncbi:MAG TPA: dihydrolipoamide acetyltransferase family protein [Tepidisphaeraceae bacterium]|nr:dihydrolipoamide acetyltransferase family protein [Tepidisphaeraceae bacterium]
MPAEITMPQLSDTMTEGTVVKWLKKEGDKVRAGEVIAEVETDKANMEMEAFEAGTLAVIAVPEGGKAAVGAAIAILATGSEKVEDVKKSGSTTAKAAASAPAGNAVARPEASNQQAAPKAAMAAASAGQERVPQPAESGGAVATHEAASRSEIHEPDGVGHGATRGPAHAVPPLPHGNGNGNGNGSRVFASPLARRVAADKGVDLAEVKGTGPNGRVVQADVLSYQPTAKQAGGATEEKTTGKPAAKSEATAPARVGTGEKQVIPLTKMRQTIAARLQQSKQQIPHFYETVDVDVEALSELRERVNKQLEKEKVRLSIGDFIAKAVATALVQHPAVNAHYDGKNNQIIRYGDVHLGMAVALPDGLIVPVLRHINQMGLKEIRQRSAELVDKARGQKLKGDEMSGATFTVSNLGTFGVKEFAAIVNPPEVGILAIAAAEPRAVVRNGQIVARTIMSITLSADHRAVDGAVAADFLRTLKNLLEEPGLMLV